MLTKVAGLEACECSMPCAPWGDLGVGVSLRWHFAGVFWPGSLKQLCDLLYMWAQALERIKAADVKKEKALSPTDRVAQRLSMAAAAAANAAAPLANNITSFTSAAASTVPLAAVTSQLQVAFVPLSQHLDVLSSASCQLVVGMYLLACHCQLDLVAQICHSEKLPEKNRSESLDRWRQQRGIQQPWRRSQQ